MTGVHWLLHQIPRPLAAGKAVGRLTPLLVGRLHGRKLSLILIRNDLRSCLAVWRQGVINEEQMYELCVTLLLPPGSVVSSQPQSEKYIPKDEAIARGLKNPPRNVRTVFNSSDVVQRRKFAKGKQRRNRDDKLQLRACLLPDSALYLNLYNIQHP